MDSNWDVLDESAFLGESFLSCYHDKNGIRIVMTHGNGSAQVAQELSIPRDKIPLLIFAASKALIEKV